MPNTCRTDTFMSGKPAGSCALVMAAVVINPPRSRTLPKPDLRWPRMGAGANLSESNDWQKPAAQSKFRCVIIKIGIEHDFWKAALRITPYFRPDDLPSARRPSPMALFTPVLSYVRSAPTGIAAARQEICDIIHRSPDYVRLGACLACLSHAIPRRPSGSRSHRRFGDSRLDHHPGAERADSRRRIAA